MFKKIYSLAVLSIAVISSHLSAEIEYNIQDIGTLQTHSSQAIALNNQGQILGWYNINGTSSEGNHYFVRDKDGNFSELPSKESGTNYLIDWKYLTDDGKAYGIFSPSAILYTWDSHNGVVRLGNLPGTNIAAINNAGQVLIESTIDHKDGKSIILPVIWHNGTITKLKGLSGDLGIESDESYGLGMNNNGDVVGQSVAYLSYKNNVYKQVHATMWIEGQPIDLQDKIPKNFADKAKAINDRREVFIGGWMLLIDGSFLKVWPGSTFKTMSNNYLCYDGAGVFDMTGKGIFSTHKVRQKITDDLNTIWLDCIDIISVNDNGEAIARGKTIYGEDHAMLLTPIKSE